MCESFSAALVEWWFLPSMDHIITQMWSQTGFNMSNTSNRWKKKGVKGKSSFSFRWATIAYVGGQGSEDSFYMCVCVCFVCFFAGERKGERCCLWGCSLCDSSLLPGHCLLVVSVNRRFQRRSKTSPQPPKPTQEPRSGPLTFRHIRKRNTLNLPRR